MPSHNPTPGSTPTPMTMPPLIDNVPSTSPIIIPSSTPPLLDDHIVNSTLADMQLDPQPPINYPSTFDTRCPNDQRLPFQYNTMNYSPINDPLTRLVQKPSTFSGTGDKFQRRHTQVWLDRMQTWLTCLNIPEAQQVNIAMTYLLPPAYNVMTIQQKILQKSQQWTNTFTQFSDIIRRHYGEIDPDFEARQRLFKLECNDERQLIRYARQFQDTASRLLDDPLTDATMISQFFNGITNPKLFQELVIEPNTGQRWKSYDHLHNYILHKYGSLKTSSTRPFFSTSRYSKPPPMPDNFSRMRPRFKQSFPPRRPLPPLQRSFKPRSSQMQQSNYGRNNLPSHGNRHSHPRPANLSSLQQNRQRHFKPLNQRPSPRKPLQLSFANRTPQRPPIIA